MVRRVSRLSEARQGEPPSDTPEPGFDLPRASWQEPVGVRLLTPKELAARVRYFARAADRAVARARTPA
jgi:hypothetical protein